MDFALWILAVYWRDPMGAAIVGEKIVMRGIDHAIKKQIAIFCVQIQQLEGTICYVGEISNWIC